MALSAIANRNKEYFKVQDKMQRFLVLNTLQVQETKAEYNEYNKNKTISATCIAKKCLVTSSFLQFVGNPNSLAISGRSSL